MEKIMEYKEFVSLIRSKVVVTPFRKEGSYLARYIKSGNEPELWMIRQLLVGGQYRVLESVLGRLSYRFTMSDLEYAINNCRGTDNSGVYYWVIKLGLDTNSESEDYSVLDMIHEILGFTQLGENLVLQALIDSGFNFNFVGNYHQEGKVLRTTPLGLALENEYLAQIIVPMILGTVENPAAMIAQTVQYVPGSAKILAEYIDPFDLVWEEVLRLLEN